MRNARKLLTTGHLERFSSYADICTPGSTHLPSLRAVFQLGDYCDEPCWPLEGCKHMPTLSSSVHSEGDFTENGKVLSPYN